MLSRRCGLRSAKSFTTARDRQTLAMWCPLSSQSRITFGVSYLVSYLGSVYYSILGLSSSLSIWLQVSCRGDISSSSLDANSYSSKISKSEFWNSFSFLIGVGFTLKLGPESCLKLSMVSLNSSFWIHFIVDSRKSSSSLDSCHVWDHLSPLLRSVGALRRLLEVDVLSTGLTLPSHFRVGIGWSTWRLSN